MKKKTKNELIGRAIQVHPELTTDPQSRQGEAGIVIEMKKNNEVANVEFKDGGRADYETDGLLMLYPKDIMLQGIISNPEIGVTNQKLILKIQKLADKRQYDEALKLAITNDTMQFHCTTNVDHWMDILREQSRNPRRTRKL